MSVGILKPILNITVESNFKLFSNREQLQCTIS